MVFNSPVFIIFFLILLLVYNRVQKASSIHVRNSLLLIASYLFYGWWDWRFLALIFISSLCDFIAGIQIVKANSKTRQRAWLGISLLVNLGLLGYFKYVNFFIDSLEEVLDLAGFNWQMETLQVILPVGISFYTFQTLSYTIDIYRGKIKPTKNALAFFTYVAFFPQLVAGPIERASHLLPQFLSHQRFDYSQAVQGLRLALWGFFMKIVIADNFGLVSDLVFDPEYLSHPLTRLFAALSFGFQVYGDFGGYSAIAIGTAQVLGFNLMNNFRTPLFAPGINEFWRR